MWKNQLKADPTPWLLEAEPPGVRYLAMRDLMDLPENDPELAAARREAYEQGPIRAVLEAMEPMGYWVRSGAGYNPKYRSAVWSLLMLAQLGASIADDERIDRACEYYLEHALADGGQFSLTGTPAGTIDCLQGNMCWALVALGCTDSRLEPAFDWMARTVTGEGNLANL